MSAPIEPNQNLRGAIAKVCRHAVRACNEVFEGMPEDVLSVLDADCVEQLKSSLVELDAWATQRLGVNRRGAGGVADACADASSATPVHGYTSSARALGCLVKIMESRAITAAATCKARKRNKVKYGDEASSTLEQVLLLLSAVCTVYQLVACARPLSQQEQREWEMLDAATDRIEARMSAGYTAGYTPAGAFTPEMVQLQCALLKLLCLSTSGATMAFIEPGSMLRNLAADLCTMRLVVNKLDADDLHVNQAVLREVCCALRAYSQALEGIGERVFMTDSDERHLRLVREAAQRMDVWDVTAGLDSIVKVALKAQGECFVCLSSMVPMTIMLLDCCPSGGEEAIEAGRGPHHCICTDCWAQLQKGGRETVSCPMCRAPGVRAFGHDDVAAWRQSVCRRHDARRI